MSNDLKKLVAELQEQIELLAGLVKSLPELERAAAMEKIAMMRGNVLLLEATLAGPRN